MKLELSTWNECLNGEMSLENIRQLYQPENQYRVSWNTYPSGTNFNGWSRDKRLYIIHGCCSVTIKDISFNLCSGEFTDFPEGDYQFKVISDSAIDLVSVWEIPEENRFIKNPF